jgi:hypothetical protein
MAKEQISVEAVATKILFIRGKKVMLDRDLARLYGVKHLILTKRLSAILNVF